MCSYVTIISPHLRLYRCISVSTICSLPCPCMFVCPHLRLYLFTCTSASVIIQSSIFRIKHCLLYSTLWDVVMTCTLSIHGLTTLFETCHVCALSVYHTCMTMHQSLPHTTSAHIDESMTILNFSLSLKIEIIDASSLCGLDEPSVAHYGYGMFLFQATHDQHIQINKRKRKNSNKRAGHRWSKTKGYLLSSETYEEHLDL